jgi:hypothetical protein
LRKIGLLALSCAALFCSCIGVNSVLNLRADGSGTIAMEYRIAKELLDLGKLDGNERWQTVPVGRADLERTAARIPGIKIASYSEKDAGKDRIISFKLKFENPAALAAFLDPAGRRVKVDAPSRRMVFVFSGEAADASKETFAAALLGYAFSFKAELPGNASFAWKTVDGGAAEGFGEARAEGKTFSFSSPMYGAAFPGGAFTLEVNW